MDRDGVPSQEEFLSYLFAGMEKDLNQPQKTKDQVIPLEATLEDLYNGKTTKVKLTKKDICSTCNGRGGKEGTGHKCKSCRGTGGANCGKCNGSGHVFEQKHRCRKCAGRRTVQEQKTLQVVIAPGMHDGQKIVLKSEGDQEPGIAEAGNVIIVLKAKPHKEFERQGNNLIVKRTITLTEALCGFSMEITHLDGRKVSFENEAGKVIKQNSIHQVTGEGMPIEGTNSRGNLFITFEVCFPEQSLMTKDAYEKLESLLERRPIESLPIVGESVKEVSLSPVDSRQQRSGNPFEQIYDTAEKSNEKEFYQPPCAVV
jgi:DnaJ family protein A protein 2